MTQVLQTEFPFTLPRGYVDPEGSVHRTGTMRLATAADEIVPYKDPRVQANEAYLAILVLSRVVELEGVAVNPKVVEGFWASDLAYLQELYNRINANGEGHLTAVCPECSHRFEVEADGLGGVLTYPREQLYEELAFIAYYLHWPADQILGLDHAERRRWVSEVSRINEALSGGAAEQPWYG